MSQIGLIIVGQHNGTVVSTLLLPHSKKFLGSILGLDLGFFSVEFECSPCVCMGFPRYSIAMGFAWLNEG